MQLKDIMTHGVEVIPPEASVKVAAEKMKQFNIGSLPVCDGGQLVGMITDRDITLRTVAEGRNLTTPVREVMTPKLVYCFADQDVQEAARLMEAHLIRRLPILNREKRLVGIVSLDDLAAGTGDQQLAGEVLEQVAEQAQPLG